ncbi:serine/threonine-protein kinase VRK2 isoform X2 [Nothobranchius furzeri]|nr:serine/threonine-protein kinase VRK2 isoform X1 [Nothobranchius furzeri]
MAPPRKSRLPKPLPEGFILMDTERKRWRLGKVIGQGGFGLIYLASQEVDRAVAEDSDYVIKVEYQENGPLFSELKFYQRAAKAGSIQKWKRDRGLDFLGIPTYWGSGLAEHQNLRYRFMAMDRLGSDLQKICESGGGRLKKATVLQLGQRLVDVLEYIHDNEYVHADIKAANVMLGYRDPDQVYLADYGLSYRYCPDGVHKEYKENPKKGHNGTMEYTSLDAHKGLGPSRRSDLQILGFCLLHWLCGSLPWDGVLKHPAQVQEAKARLMDNLPDSVLELSVDGAVTDEVALFLLHVKTLDYQDKPDYQLLKALLTKGVTGRLDFSVPAGSAGRNPRSRDKKAEPARTRPEPVEVDYEDPDRRKTKAVPARYIRGPPLRNDHPQQDPVPPAVRRTLKQRSRGAHEDEGSEEEAEARPKAIPACYLRGPPVSRGARPKQVPTAGRPEKPPTWNQRHRTCFSHTEQPELGDGGPVPVGVGHGQIFREDGDGSVPDLTHSQRSWFFYVWVGLLLGVVLECAKVLLDRFDDFSS